MCPAPLVVDYPLSAATADRTPVVENMLARARAFAEPLIADEMLDTGENTLAHADAVAAILAAMGGSEAMQAASYLVYSCQHLNRPQEVIAKAFGDNFAALAVETTKLVHVQKQARSADGAARSSRTTPSAQTENVRKMLLAFSRDLRVVMLRLASRLQTLRYYAAPASSRCPPAWRASRCRCSRRWPTGWASGRSSGRSRTWPSASSSPRPTSTSRGCWTRSASSAKAMSSSCARGWSASCKAQGIKAAGAGPAQAHLQHRQEDARQVARLRRRCSTSARCA